MRQTSCDSNFELARKNNNKSGWLARVLSDAETTFHCFTYPEQQTYHSFVNAVNATNSPVKEGEPT